MSEMCSRHAVRPSASRCVLANTDSKLTFLKLVDRSDLDEGFARDIEQLRMGHSSNRGHNAARRVIADLKKR